MFENIQDTLSEEGEKTSEPICAIKQLLTNYKNQVENVKKINDLLDYKKKESEEIKKSVVNEVDEFYKMEGLPDFEFLEKYLEYSEKIGDVIKEEEKTEE